MTKEATNSVPVRAGFDENLAGRLAECDGGGPIEGTRYAGRQDFRGRLTGEYVEEGDPPSRWYLMTDLTLKPPQFPSDAVWCEAGNIFLIREPVVREPRTHKPADDGSN